MEGALTATREQAIDTSEPFPKMQTQQQTKGYHQEKALAKIEKE